MAREPCDADDGSTEVVELSDTVTSAGSGSEGESTAPDAADALGIFTVDGEDESPVPETVEFGSPINLMLRNIPSRVGRNDLISLLESSGFPGRFDYLYLPFKPRSGQNRGYAFVGLPCQLQADVFTVLLQDKSFGGSRASEKALAIVPATSVIRTVPCDIVTFSRWGPVFAC
jgi:hypothetical protein